MRKFLLIILASAGSFLNVLAQEPQLGVNIEDEFKVTTVPEKWNNESAVIIGQKQEYLFTRLAAGRKYTTTVRINEFIHKRIKLQDKNALEKFSTFYFVTMGREGKAEYKIIKASGKTIDVDMKNAIEEESDVPAIYKPIYYKMNVKSMKLAIPDLEVGDIIDYTVHASIDWDMKENGIEFSPFIFSLSNSYPTMYQQYRFTMANGMKVKYRSYNGAPSIKFDPKSSVYGDKNSYLTYYFLDKDREKTLEERWSYEIRNTPSVKFRVVLYSDNDTESKGLGEATVDRSGLSIDEVYKRYVGAALYVTPTVNSLVGYTTQYVLNKKADGTLKTDDETIRDVYYCLRKVFLEMYYKGPVHSELEKYMTGKKLYKKIIASEKKDTISRKLEKEDEIRMNSVTFVTALRMSLAAVGIPSELHVYVPRWLGNWRDAIFMEELDFVLKVKSNRKYYYLDAFNNFDAFGTVYTYLEGTEGYSIGYDEVNRYYRATVPATKATENLDKQEYVISFPEAMDVVKVERTSSFLGAEKNSRMVQANLVRDYLNHDFEKYFAEPKAKGKKKNEDVMPAASFAKYEDPDAADRIKERKELFHKDAKAEFDVDRYDDFELIENGRFGDTSLLQYKEKFVLKKLVSKAGKNYIFEVGKLIGDQIKLDEKELAGRQKDIWISNARTIENTIVINIPAGYAVDALQELEMNIDNESGTFISTAKMEDDKLIVSTKKVYKKIFDKKEVWTNYIAFLEPAYKFSQQKIVLKKK